MVSYVVVHLWTFLSEADGIRGLNTARFVCLLKERHCVEGRILHSVINLGVVESMLSREGGRIVGRVGVRQQGLLAAMCWDWWDLWPFLRAQEVQILAVQLSPRQLIRVRVAERVGRDLTAGWEWKSAYSKKQSCNLMLAVQLRFKHWWELRQK